MRIGFIISLIFAIVVAIFGIQNSTIISVNFFSANISISLALIIFISTIIGAIIVTLLGLKKEFTLSHGNRVLTKKAKNFQSEIETHKNESIVLKTENEIFKTQIQDLEARNKALKEQINELNIEVKQMNKISATETNSL